MITNSFDKYELIISEPWSESNAQEVEKIKDLFTIDGEYCIYCENWENKQGFLVRCRYLGDDLKKVMSGNKIVVGIFKLIAGKSIEQIDGLLNIQDSFYYYGIGSIRKIY